MHSVCAFYSTPLLFNRNHQCFLSSHTQTLLTSLGAPISVLGTAEAWFFLSFIIFTNGMNSVTCFRLSTSTCLHSGRGEAVKVIPDFLAKPLFLRSSPAFQEPNTFYFVLFGFLWTDRFSAEVRKLIKLVSITNSGTACWNQWNTRTSWLHRDHKLSFD